MASSKAQLDDVERATAREPLLGASVEKTEAPATPEPFEVAAVGAIAPEEEQEEPEAPTWKHERCGPCALVCCDKGLEWFMCNYLCHPVCMLGVVADVTEEFSFREGASRMAKCCCLDMLCACTLGVNPHFTDCCFTYTTYTVRRNMIEKYGFEESECSSVVRACCCNPCTVSQMLMEVEARHEGEATGFGTWRPTAYDERGSYMRRGRWFPHQQTAVATPITDAKADEKVPMAQVMRN